MKLARMFLNQKLDDAQTIVTVARTKAGNTYLAVAAAAAEMGPPDWVGAARWRTAPFRPDWADCAR